MKTLQDTERRSESKNKRVIGRGLKEVSLVLLGRAENDSAQVSVDCYSFLLPFFCMFVFHFTKTCFLNDFTVVFESK